MNEPLVDSKDDKHLPESIFSESRQAAIIGHLLSNEVFFQNGLYKIEPDWFPNIFHARIWILTRDWFYRTKRRPTRQELLEHPAILCEDPAWTAKFRFWINESFHFTTMYGLDAIKPDLSEWMHYRLIKRTLQACAGEYNAAMARTSDQRTDKLAKIKGIFKETSKDLDNGFADSASVQFGEYEGYLVSQAKKFDRGLTFGVKTMDYRLALGLEDRLAQGLEGGPLLPGGSTVIMAPMGTGKTTCMITVARYNLFRKDPKDILYLSHEDHQDNIRVKVLASILGMTLDEVLTGYLRPGYKEVYDGATKLLDDHFNFIPMVKAGLSVEEVSATVRREQEKKIAETGKGYDMLIDDYPAILTTNMAQHGNLQYRQVLSTVYGHFFQLALELDLHCLSAIQTNREGYKTNREAGQASKLLIPSDVSEAFAALFPATNIISLNQDDEARALNRLTYYIGKARLAPSGIAVVCRSDYAHNITHGDSLGAVWYYGGSSMGSKIETVLADKDYYGKMIDPTKIVGNT